VTVAVRDWEPLEPVTVTMMFGAVVNVHDNVALPEPATLVGVMLQAVLSAVRLTTPLKPFTAVTVMVEVPAVPTLAATVVGLAVTAKS
jgi:hypothetical protein